MVALKKAKRKEKCALTHNSILKLKTFNLLVDRMRDPRISSSGSADDCHMIFLAHLARSAKKPTSLLLMMEKLTKMLSKTLGTYSRLRCMKAVHQSRGVCTSTVAQYKWEPDGLSLEPDIPIYNPLNLCLYSYDFVALESFSNYVFRAVLDQKIPADRWVVPVKKMKVNTTKPKTKIVIDTCNLSRYQRVIHLPEIESIKLPILLERIQQNTPEGVEVMVREHTEDDEEFLYVPDLEKMNLEKELQRMEDEREQKRKHHRV